MKDTKDFIIKTASMLFLQKGYKGVSMTDLVKKSGLTKGAFYYYFASKEILFKAVLETFITHVSTPNDKDSDKTLYQFYHDEAERIAQAMSPPDLGDQETRFNFFSLFFEASNVFPDIRDMIQDLLQRQKDSWTKIVKRAKKTGEIKTPMKEDHIAEMFVSSSDGVGMYYVLLRQNEFKKALMGLWNSFYEGLK
jgi:AcrR family transcriptional regulator